MLSPSLTNCWEFKDLVAYCARIKLTFSYASYKFLLGIAAGFLENRRFHFMQAVSKAVDLV